ncbi:MAG: M23 family metallopeptidase [Bdellovibrionia bacterium]
MTGIGRLKHSRQTGFRFFLGWVLISLAGVQFSCVTRPVVREEPPSAPEVRAGVKVELSSPQVAQGELLRVTLKFEDPAEAALLDPSELRGEFETIRFPFFTAPELGEGVYEGLLGIPYERAAGPGVIRVSAGEQKEISISVVEGKYPSEVLRVDGRRVNPTKKKDLARIQKEVAEVAQIYQSVTREKHWRKPFVLPIQSSVTSPFGSKRIYNGRLKNYHPGMDLRAPMLTPVYASAPGRVVLAKDLFYTGHTVMIDHGYGVITLYAHMNELKVQAGALVDEKQLLGLSGKTGRVSGPHLHWQAVVNRVKVNPLGLVEVVK